MSPVPPIQAAPPEQPVARPGHGHLRRRDPDIRRPLRHRRRRVVVLGEHAPCPARGRCRCPRGRGLPAGRLGVRLRGGPEAAVRNGYTNGAGGVKVTPFVDPDDPRQLDVRVEGQVQSFFAQVFGIKGWPVSRTGEGVYIQPVPMGSPDAYYGVGDFWTNVSTTNTSSRAPSRPCRRLTTTRLNGGTWSFSNGFRRRSITTVVENNDNEFAFTNTTNAKQQWANFGLATNGGSPVPNRRRTRRCDLRHRGRPRRRLLDAGVLLRGVGQGPVRAVLGRRRELVHPADDEQPQHDNSTDFVFGNTASNTGWGTGNAGWGAHNWVGNEPDGRELPGPRDLPQHRLREPHGRPRPGVRARRLHPHHHDDDRHADEADREGPQRFRWLVLLFYERIISE